MYSSTVKRRDLRGYRKVKYVSFFWCPDSYWTFGVDYKDGRGNGQTRVKDDKKESESSRCDPRNSQKFIKSLVET